MKGNLKVSLLESNGTKYESVVEFNFRLRDLESYFITDDDEIVAMIGRLDRVFQWDEILEKEFEYELNKKQ